MSTTLCDIAKRWFDEVWNEQRVDAIDELAHPDVVFHDPSVGTVEQIGAAGFKEIVRTLLGAIPDIHFTVEDAITERDRVALRFIVTGTHTGPGLGTLPTNRAFEIGGMAIGIYRDGKLVEGWNSFDLLSLFEQVGALQRPV